MIFIFLISGLFIAWSLGANDTGNIFGAAVATRMIQFKRAALIAAIFISAGAILEGSGPSATLGKLGSVDAIGGAFTVCLAAAGAILVIVRLGIPVAISQTIVGALIGWNFFSGRLTSLSSLLTIASAWVIAFVTSACVAALYFFILRGWINHSKRHLLEQDMLLRFALIFFGAMGAYFLGANNIANAVGVFVPVTPFKDINIGSVFSLNGVLQLYIVGAIALVLGIYTYSRKVMGTVGKELLQLSPATALVALLAEFTVLFLFSSRGLHRLLLVTGLPTIPLVPISSTQVMVGAVIGIGLAKGGKNIRYNVLGKVSLAWIAAPTMAFLFSYVALFITQNVFELEVYRPLSYTVDKPAVLEMERQGIDTKNLAFVNLRTFESEMSLYKELKADKAYSQDLAKKIVQICENRPLLVKMEDLYQKGLDYRFDTAQLAALQKLEGKQFRRKWQLQHELTQDPSWKLIDNPEKQAQKDFNAGLQGDYDLLFKVFYNPPKAGK
jgi:inorganic phosphate transporter, PiT family